MVKFGTMQNLKSIGQELIEILSFINTVTLVQFWVTLFFSGTKAKSRTLPSYARAVLKEKKSRTEDTKRESLVCSKVRRV